MQLRRFGRLGWEVSAVGYGMWGMAGWTGSDDQESRRALQAAVDLGCNFFDTAWAYGEGKSEGLLGDLVRANAKSGRRLYTATKIPPKNRSWPSRREFTLDDCYPPDHIDAYVRKSLANSGLARFDLVQFHTWEDGWLKDPRWHHAITALRREGLLEGVGISLNRFEPWNGVEAVRSGAIDAVQVVYNIFDQNPEDQLLHTCADKGVAVIARVPFDEGSLTGTLNASSRWAEGDFRNSYFDAANLEATLPRVEALRSLLPAGMTMPEMALRFILGNAAVATVIPGMRKVRHVESNLAAATAGSLPPVLQSALRQHRWDRLGRGGPR
jgi:aryl-alcohol dehydrogenase-like predicted oxidoreductase